MRARVGLLFAAVAALAACGADSDAAGRGGERTTANRTANGSSSSPTIATSTSPPTSPPTSPASAAVPDGDDAAVSSVSDGDTIVLVGGTRVRLIGIDTPETRHPSKPVQCFGAEASAHTRSLLPAGTAVRLAYDVERFDRYRRTLAYVYRLSDGLFVNAALVREGYAQAYTYPPNVAHADELVALAREAREAGRGLWSGCAGFGAPAGPPPSVASGPAAGTGCDSAYPGVCIASPPPDLDCPQLRERRFAVIAPDPHGFDRDGDGLGCET